MGILEKLILGLIVITLPLGEIARFSFNEVAITLLDVGTVAVVLFWIFLKRRIPHSDLKKPIIIFVFVLFTSLIINIPRLRTSELLVSSLYLIRYFFYALLFFTVLDLGSIKKKIEKAMLISGAVLVAGGYVQYFLYPDLRNLYYAGWDEHLYRMFSTFLDPNFAGSFFVLYLLFLTDKLFEKRTILLKFFSALTLIAIILTFSRSAYISLFFGLACLLFMNAKKNLAAGITILFTTIIIAVVLLSPKSEGTNLLRIASGEARLDSIKNAFAIFKDHPILGVGFNSYRYAQRDYGFLNESKMIVHSGAGTDNSFLFILVTAGIVGIAALLYLLFKIVSIKDPLIVSTLLVLIINSLFINSLFYPPIMLWMWILVGLRRSA